MSEGLVTFVLGAREYATPLSAIREVVRLEGLADLPGMTPPLAGVLDLRGTALPVLDLRLGDSDARGDVLVMESSEDALVGVAVDHVRSVVGAGELTPAGGGAEELPSYVREVLRGPLGTVFLVNLPAMVDSAQEGRTVKQLKRVSDVLFLLALALAVVGLVTGGSAWFAAAGAALVVSGVATVVKRRQAKAAKAPAQT